MRLRKQIRRLINAMKGEIQEYRKGPKLHFAHPNLRK